MAIEWYSGGSKSCFSLSYPWKQVGLGVTPWKLWLGFAGKSMGHVTFPYLPHLWRAPWNVGFSGSFPLTGAFYVGNFRQWSTGQLSISSSQQPATHPATHGLSTSKSSSPFRSSHGSWRRKEPDRIGVGNAGASEPGWLWYGDLGVGTV